MRRAAMTVLVGSALIGLTGLVTAASSAAHLRAGDPICVTQADTVRPHRQKLQWIVTNASPAILAVVQLPSRPPQGVTVVADDAVCARAVTAYNARLSGADTVLAVTRIIVLRIGANRYVVIRASSPTGPGLRSWLVYDNAFHFLTGTSGA
jgi:hypothetical protein